MLKVAKPGALHPRKSRSSQTTFPHEYLKFFPGQVPSHFKKLTKGLVRESFARPSSFSRPAQSLASYAFPPVASFKREILPFVCRIVKVNQRFSIFSPPAQHPGRPPAERVDPPRAARSSSSHLFCLVFPFSPPPPL